MQTYIDWSSAKAIQWTYGEFFNVSFNVEKLQQYVNDKWYVNLTLSKRKEVGQYWDTHYFVLNDWKPEAWAKTSNEAVPKANTPQPLPKHNDSISISDVPF